MDRNREPGTAPTRASDADRERLVAHLGRHYADGRLTVEEAEGRMAEAWKAVTTDELDALVADLPALRGPDPGLLRHARASRSRASLPPRLRRLPLDVQIHAVVYASVIAFLVFLWFVTGADGSFWPIFPALGWGLGLAIHGGVRTIAARPSR